MNNTVTDIFESIKLVISASSEGIPTIVDEGLIRRLDKGEEPITMLDVQKVFDKVSHYYREVVGNHSFQDFESTAGRTQIISRIKPAKTKVQVEEE